MKKWGIRKILYAGYIEFFLSIIFWIGAGVNAFHGIEPWVYVVLLGFLGCSIVIIGCAMLYEHFYMDSVRKSYQDLEQLNAKLRTQRHEYLNEMQVVYGLLELKEYEEAVAYLKPIYEDIAKVGKALRTKKPAVNALLCAKMEQAEKMKVDFYIEVSSDLHNLQMEQWDVCKILSNLTDNAMTAVKDNAASKEVHLQIIENATSYVFCVYNNGPVIAPGKLNLIFQKGYSSKKEAGHGLGLGIVKDITNQYHGQIEVQSAEGKTQFEVTIPKERALTHKK